MSTLHRAVSEDKQMHHQIPPFDPREQRVAWPDSPEDRERRLAKLDLLALVDELGVEGARGLLPKLGMTEHYGINVVRLWLDNIAKGVGR